MLGNGEALFTSCLDPSNPDWDGDGLKNGQEIAIELDHVRKIPYIRMISNPLMQNTDGDMYDDYEELINMNTSPTKYTYPANAVEYIADDGNYPTQYLHDAASKWLNFQDVAMYGKPSHAKNTIIDYVADYATTNEVISRDTEQSRRRLLAEQNAETLAIASEILKLVKEFLSLTSKWDTGLTEEQINAIPEDEINTMKAMNAELSDFMTKLKGAKEADLKDPAGFNVLKFISEGQNTSQKLVDMLTNFNARSIVKSATAGMKLAKAIHKLTGKKWTVTGKFAAVSNFSKSASGKLVGGTISIACDVVDAYKDLEEITATFAKIEANCAEYQRLAGLFEYIAGCDKYRDYIRKAGRELSDMFTPGADTDWDEFDRQIRDAQNNVKTAAAFKMAFEGLLEAGKGNPIVRKIKLVYDIAKIEDKLLGISDQMEKIVESQAYYAITNGCTHLFGKNIFAQDGYYNASDSTEAEKYFMHMAQGRMVGLNLERKFVLKYNSFVGGLIGNKGL